MSRFHKTPLSTFSSPVLPEDHQALARLLSPGILKELNATLTRTVLTYPYGPSMLIVRLGPQGDYRFALIEKPEKPRRIPFSAFVKDVNHRLVTYPSIEIARSQAISYSQSRAIPEPDELDARVERVMRDLPRFLGTKMVLSPDGQQKLAGSVRTFLAFTSPLCGMPTETLLNERGFSLLGDDLAGAIAKRVICWLEDGAPLSWEGWTSSAAVDYNLPSQPEIRMELNRRFFNSFRRLFANTDRHVDNGVQPE